MPDNGASSAGASPGSLGGASKADLARGFLHISDENEANDNDGDELEQGSDPGPHGFLDRPHGYER